MENEQEIKFYSVAEESEILGISRPKAYEWLVPIARFFVMRISRRVIIPANNFNAWYESLIKSKLEEN